MLVFPWIIFPSNPSLPPSQTLLASSTNLNITYASLVWRYEYCTFAVCTIIVIILKMIYEIGRELMAAADEMKSEHRDQLGSSYYRRRELCIFIWGDNRLDVTTSPNWWDLSNSHHTFMRNNCMLYIYGLVVQYRPKEDTLINSSNQLFSYISNHFYSALTRQFKSFPQPAK